MPRGQALGMVSQLPEADELQWTKKQLLAKLDVCMAGRVAEEIIFGQENVTTGKHVNLLFVLFYFVLIMYFISKLRC